MKTGWVLAAKDDEVWQFRIVEAAGGVSVQRGGDPALAASLLAGGARLGLVCGHDDAPLTALPCDPIAALRNLPPDGAWRILPRFSQMNPLMLSAGEEVLLAGALSIAPKFDGTILIRNAANALWAQVSAGEVVSILGSITPLLRARLAPGAVADPGLVALAAADTLSRPERLAVLLASLPAERRLRDPGKATGGDLVAGWLLGAELAAARAWWLGQPVLLISDIADGAAETLAAQGITPHLLPPDAALLAGLKAVAPLD